MARIESFTDEYGQHTKNRVYTTYHTSRTGVPSEGSKTVKEQSVLRQYHSKNPISRDMGIVWRSPSDYRRLIHEYKYELGYWKSSINKSSDRDLGQAPLAHESIFSYPLSASTPSLDTADRLRAQTEAINRLNEGIVDIGILLAETKRSAEMLADTVIFTADMLRNIRRGRFPKGLFKRSIMKDSSLAANVYLQYRYGWKPLLTDIYDAVESVKKGLSFPQLVTAQRTVKSRYGTTANRGNWRNRRLEAHTRATCKLYAKLDDEFIFRAQSAGILNPLSVTWEVIPYSFVVDWLIPVGNFLESLTAKSGLSFVGGYTSKYVYGTVKGEYAQSTYNPRPRLTAKVMEYHRTKLHTFPIATPYIKSPFSTSNTLAAAALVRQLI